MIRRWSKVKDGMGFYYSVDGEIPQLNVRLEPVSITDATDYRWVAYCGDIQIQTLSWTRQSAQQEAEKYWEANYGTAAR